MKLSVATLAFLALAFVTSATGIGRAAPTPQLLPSVDTKTVNFSIEDLFKAKEEESVEVTCVSDPKEKTDRCVPYLRFSDEVNEESTKHAVKWIKAANEAGANELLIEINTNGGSIPDGFEMARAIEDSDAPVTCIVDGDADSMGFYITQSCAKRYITPRSKMMAHEPSIGGMIGGQPNLWKSIADMMAAERDAIAVHCQHRLKVSLAEYHRRTDGGLMWWLLPAEALKVRAVDGIEPTVKGLHKKMLHVRK